MRITLLAGGSGGHISPALAVASKIREKHPSAEISFFTSRTALDKDILEKSGEQYTRIFSGKWRRYFSWQNFIDPFFIVLGFFQSFFLFIRKRPDIIFSKGGFSALPPVLAAAVLQIPIIAHESDAVPGVANRITQRFAKKILTSFPSDFGEHVGTPLRAGIASGNAEEGKNFLGFSDKKPIVFGFGGSQGADNMNKNCAQVVKEILPKANFVWIYGPKNKDHFPKEEGVRSFPYIHKEFFDLVAAADIIVSRAGSSSVFELAAMKKPMILIPLSTAAGNHQEKNAKVFKEKGAAEMILEKDLTPELFEQTLLKLLGSEEKRKSLSDAAEKIGKNAAAEKIVEILFQSSS